MKYLVYLFPRYTTVGQKLAPLFLPHVCASSLKSDSFSDSGMAPKERLEQVSGHLTGSHKVHGARFRPLLPAGLPAHFTPLNPVAFLLKAASIRPNHPAIVHPEKGLSWTYEQWSVLCCFSFCWPDMHWR